MLLDKLALSLVQSAEMDCTDTQHYSMTSDVFQAFPENI